jgi:hypothetical protein
MQKKAGRPAAIPYRLMSLVLSLHSSGMGYRAIAHELCNSYGVSADWSTVRRVCKCRTPYNDAGIVLK